MEPNDNYKVFNEDIEIRLKELGDVIGHALPPNWGFTLLLFDFNAGDKGSLFYIANGQREDIVALIKEFIALDEKGKDERTNKS